MKESQIQLLETFSNYLENLFESSQRKETPKSFVTSSSKFSCSSFVEQGIEGEVYNKINQFFEQKIEKQKVKMENLKGENQLKEYLNQLEIFNSMKKIITNDTKPIERFWIPSQKDKLKVSDVKKKTYFFFFLILIEKACE